MKFWLCLLPLLAACEPVSFDPVSRVNNVRILAIRADAPYARPGDNVTVDTLAVDGRAQQPEPMGLFWLPAPCFNPIGDTYYGCFPRFAQQFRRGAEVTSALVEGTSLTFGMPEDVIATHEGERGTTPYGLAVVFAMACAGRVFYEPPGVSGSVDAVPFACRDSRGARLGADDFVFAYALVYSFEDRVNQNPVIERVDLAGGPASPADGIHVPRCTESKLEDCPLQTLRVVVPPTSQELDPNNLDVDGNALKEQLYARLYMTAGEAKDATVVLYDPRDGQLGQADDGIRAPQAAGEHRLWVVVHDNRGGVSWEEFALHVE